MSSNPVSGPLPCCGQLALVNECNRDVTPTIEKPSPASRYRLARRRPILMAEGGGNV
jgi:hypothetical protein